MSSILKGLQLNELSNEKLGQYKKAASADATAADKAGDYKRGDKRFSGIVKATKKQFANDEKQLKEFAPVGGDDREPDEEEILRQLAAQWFNGDEDPRAEKTLAAMGWEIGYDESGDDDAGVFLIRPGDINGDTYIAFNQSDLELNEAFNNYHANRTGFSRGQRDDERHDLDVPAKQEWALKINGKVWSKDGKAVTFASREQALKARQSILSRKPELEVGLVTRSVAEGRYDSDDYYNPRMSREYGARNLHTDSGAYEFEKNVPAGEPGGPRGAPKSLKGISKKLPADPFGRTTGKIPAGKPGTVHSMMRDIDEEQIDELKCWSGYTRVQGVPAGAPGSCKKKTNEEHNEKCPHCGGEMVSEELMNEKKDACYYKVKSRYKVWPSAYASGALVKCRKSGADSWGNGGKKNESSILEGIEQVDENLNKWFKEKWVRFGPDGKIRGDCARGDDSEGKPKCLPQSKAHSLGKKGRASAAARKRREDPNPERSGKAINVNTKKKANEDQLDEKWSQKYKDSINCSNPKGFSQKAHCQGKNK